MSSWRLSSLLYNNNTMPVCTLSLNPHLIEIQPLQPARVLQSPQWQGNFSHLGNLKAFNVCARNVKSIHRSFKHIYGGGVEAKYTALSVILVQKNSKNYVWQCWGKKQSWGWKYLHRFGDMPGKLHHQCTYSEMVGKYIFKMSSCV